MLAIIRSLHGKFRQTQKKDARCPGCQMSLDECILMSRCPRIPCCSDVCRCSPSNTDVDHLLLALQRFNHLQIIKRSQRKKLARWQPPALSGVPAPAHRSDERHHLVTSTVHETFSRKNLANEVREL